MIVIVILSEYDILIKYWLLFDDILYSFVNVFNVGFSAIEMGAVIIIIINIE